MESIKINSITGYETKVSECGRVWKIVYVSNSLKLFRNDELVSDKSEFINNLYVQLKIYCTEPIDFSMSIAMFEDLSKSLGITETSFEEMLQVFYLLKEMKQFQLRAESY